METSIINVIEKMSVLFLGELSEKDIEEAKRIWKEKYPGKIEWIKIKTEGPK